MSFPKELLPLKFKINAILKRWYEDDTKAKLNTVQAIDELSALGLTDDQIAERLEARIFSGLKIDRQ